MPTSITIAKVGSKLSQILNKPSKWEKIKVSKFKKSGLTSYYDK